MHSVFLKYLDEVARQGSIRKAARVLNVSSTAVNRKILSIEAQFGTRLFDRTPEGVEITETGKIILGHCRQTLYEFNKIKMLIDDLRDLRTGHLNIKTLDSFTFSVLPRILRKFSEDYPGINLSVSTGLPEDIANAVATGDADFGFSFTHTQYPGVRVLTEKTAPFGMIMRPDHPLAARNSLTVSDLKGYPLVRTSDARSWDSILDNAIDANLPELSTHIFTNALTVAKNAILGNQAIGIYTKIGFLEEIDAGDLVFIPLKEPELQSCKMGLTISSGASIDPLKHIFQTTVERVFRALRFDP